MALHRNNLQVVKLLFVTSIAFVSCGITNAFSAERLCVTVDRLNVRLSPNQHGKVTNKLDRGQILQILEFKGNYARISRYYDGEIEGLKGRVARWVAKKYLAKTCQKPKKVTPASRLEKALVNSDDYRKHKSIFINSAKKLISSKICSYYDLQYNGGWTRSVNYKYGMYFTYCGINKSKIYLDVRNGKLYQSR